MSSPKTDITNPTAIADPTVITRHGILRGMRENLLISFGLLPFGFAFGAAAATANLPVLDATLMSILVFAGSAQFAALGLWHAPLPLAAIAATTLIVNARHIVMGAAMQPYMKGLPRAKLMLVAALMTDSSWAYSYQRIVSAAQIGGQRDIGILLGCAFLQWPLWAGCTALGAWLGSGSLDSRAWGLDMVIPAYFAITVIGLWRGKDDALPWIAAVGATLAALLWVPGNWYILIGGAAAGLAGLWLPMREPENTQ